MAKANWTKEKDEHGHIIWRSEKNSAITIEAHQTDKNVWLIAPARKGMPLSEVMTEHNKRDAISSVAELKKTWEK